MRACVSVEHDWLAHVARPLTASRRSQNSTMIQPVLNCQYDRSGITESGLSRQKQLEYGHFAQVVVWSRVVDVAFC